MRTYTADEVEKIIERHVANVREGAVLGMLVACVVGAIVGWVAQSVLRIAGIL